MAGHLSLEERELIGISRQPFSPYGAAALGCASLLAGGDRG